MKAITLLVILSASLSSTLPSSLLMAAEPAPRSDPPAVLMAAEPAPRSDPPAVKTPPATAAKHQGGEQDAAQNDGHSSDARAVAGVDDAEAPLAGARTAPEKTPASSQPKEPGSDAPGSRGSAADKASPQRFVPSEQVRADFDVSFPIDT